MRFSVLAMLAATAFAATPTIPPVDVAETLRQVPVALVMAFASECNDCMTAKPIFEEIESDVPTYLVDASEEEAGAFREAYNITSFPKLILFENGKMADVYDGELSCVALQAYLSSKAVPPSPKVSSEF